MRPGGGRTQRRRYRQWLLAACRAESCQGHASRGEKARVEGFRLNLWACGQFGRGRDAWPARWPRRRIDAARRPSAGRREVEEPVSGSSVIFSKFKNQFCNFKFSPSSWPQMKSVEYHFCSVFRDVQLLCYALFHLSNGLS